MSERLQAAIDLGGAKIFAGATGAFLDFGL
jgi:hypothetical protein